MMESFNRSTGSMFAFGTKVVGALFICISIAALVYVKSLSVLFLVIPLILTGSFACFASTGASLNLHKKQIQIYWSIFGFEFGKWQKLPELKLISVTPHTQTYSNRRPNGGINNYSKEHTYRLNLKGTNPRINFVMATGDKNTLLKDARTLSKRMKLDILDCTGKEKILIRHSE